MIKRQNDAELNSCGGAKPGRKTSSAAEGGSAPAVRCVTICLGHGLMIVDIIAGPADSSASASAPSIDSPGFRRSASQPHLPRRIASSALFLGGLAAFNKVRKSHQ